MTILAEGTEPDDLGAPVPHGSLIISRAESALRSGGGRAVTTLSRSGM